MPVCCWGVCCRRCLLPGGVSAPGGCLLQGVSAPWGVVSQHALRQTPPVNRITDTSKNITLATTSLRPVKMHCSWKLISGNYVRNLKALQTNATCCTKISFLASVCIFSDLFARPTQNVWNAPKETAT